MSESLTQEQLNIHNELKAQFNSKFQDDLQVLASYFLPNQSDINEKKTESISGWTQDIYDTTGVQSAQIMAAGFYNWWTPPNQPWAEYSPPGQDDKEEAADDDSVQYLERASAKMMRELGRSNFYSIKGAADNAFASFNTDTIIFDEAERGPELFNFVPCKIGTYTIEEDYTGIVDTLRREVEMTFRQIGQKFMKPGDAIPPKMQEAAKGKGKSRKFKLLHCIFPRADSARVPGAKDGKNKPFASVYISMDFADAPPLRVSGYDENPILCRRFAKWGTGSVWGYGPSYLAIPDARQANYIKQYIDARAEIGAVPRVLIPDNLDGDVDLRAGGVTTWDSSNPSAKPEEWGVNPNSVKEAWESLNQIRQSIRDAFFVDAFKLLNSQPLLDKEMTAFEISQRQAEQLQGVTPASTRMIPEFVNPLMKRGFGILFRAGKLGQPPAALLQQIGPNQSALMQPEIVVTSRFNDALRALKNRGIEETVRFVEPIAQLKPEAWDVLDVDDMIRDYARNAGAGGVIAKLKNVQAVRQARAQAMQQQRQAALAEQVAGAAGKLGHAPAFVQDAARQSLTQGRAA